MAATRFFVFTARTTRDFMTRVSAEVLYITSLSRSHCEPPRASYPISYRILFTDACTDRNSREFNPPAFIPQVRDAETGRRDAGYKLDELRSRLTPPFPHPSAKLVEFSAILPPGNLNLVPSALFAVSYPRFSTARGRIKAAAAPQSQMLRSWKSKGGFESVRVEPANRSYVTM